MTPDAPSRFRFPIIGDLMTMNAKRPVQQVTAKLVETGAGMIQAPIGQPVVFLADAALVDEVNDESRWQKHLGPSLRRLGDLLGDGLFTADNDEPNWTKAHDVLVPLFTRAAMQRYHDTMTATIDELVASWRRKSARGGWTRIPDDANRLTLEIIARAAMSFTFGDLGDLRQPPFVTTFLRELAYADRHTTDDLDDRKRQHAADKTAIRQQVAGIVATRRRQATPGTNGDLLDALLDNPDPNTSAELGDDNVVNQLLTLLVVGSETSANAISFALHFLSENPHVAARARSEVDALWAASASQNIEFDDVDQLTYLRCIIDETLRLWPAAPGYFRRARHDTTIGGQHHFRTGEWVFVHLIAAHRSNPWGPDAHVFNPDRFLPENLDQLPKRTYKPFGTGPRSCLGRRFATHEMLLTLAAVLHHFDLQPRPGYTLTATEAMTLKPYDLTLRLSPRPS
ncbi:MAG: cytochrome P450 [Gordonia sp. (in: high G+C Gram-positive bacteria)]|uniref:cytochrome P450 n=1 Tax=Gordonia sp. (in: high G+C Gram-positive bacteria) TaxID=84139 RepID=UPI003BB55F7F